MADAPEDRNRPENQSYCGSKLELAGLGGFRGEVFKPLQPVHDGPFAVLGGEA